MVFSFERIALGFLFAVVAAGSIGAAFAPSLEFGGRLDSVVQSPDAAAADLLLPKTTMSTIALNTQRFDLDAVAAGSLVPRSMDWPPPHGATAPAGELQEPAFIEQVLPLVLVVNEQILAERARLWDVRQRRSGGELSVEDRLWLASAAERYGTGVSDLAELTRRIDAVPASILIAVAASSTNWNAMDQSGWRALSRAVAGAASAIPATPATGRALPPPQSPLDTLRLYLRVLNTHSDFSPFRRARERLRHDGLPMRGASLAATLPRVAPGKLPGAIVLSDVIADQRLERFDIARLAPADPPT